MVETAYRSNMRHCSFPSRPLPWLHTFSNFTRSAARSGVLLVLGLALSAIGSQPAPLKLKDQAVTVVFSARIIPRAGGALTSPELTLRLPIDLPHQTVDEPDIEGDPKQRADLWQSPVLVYTRSELKPGQILTGRWSANARVREFQWILPPTNHSKAAVLSPEERSLYLRDAVAFGLADPVVQNAAKKAGEDKADPLSHLDAIFEHVMEKMTYERDGKWQPAPEALASGKGSCSEFTYAFIAMCRASGIPARYVGGVAGRAGVPFHIDTVFHRYPQAFLDGVGWVDFDPTRNKRAKDRRLYFWPNLTVIWCCYAWATAVKAPSPDGITWSHTVGLEALPRHHASARHGGSLNRLRACKKPWPRSGATWHNPARTPKRSSPKALAIDHPFVLPWLDDLLYGPGARVSAAKACLKNRWERRAPGGHQQPQPVAGRRRGPPDRQFAGHLYRSEFRQRPRPVASLVEKRRPASQRGYPNHLTAMKLSFSFPPVTASLVLAALVSTLTPASGQDTNASQPFDFEAASRNVPKPRDVWPLVRKHLVPLEWKVLANEIVVSDTDPAKQLRKITAHFWSQELAGKKWGHPCVLFLARGPRSEYDRHAKGKSRHHWLSAGRVLFAARREIR